MKDIYIYASIQTWISETPDAVVKGFINSKNQNYIEITDDHGYTQILNLDKVFAVVY
ncbi:MAG: hypothetical protein N2645_07680 [Clostridia bacterium]|nr:hypothetical protein [Clostridia bacterium]